MSGALSEDAGSFSIGAWHDRAPEHVPARSASAVNAGGVYRPGRVTSDSTKEKQGPNCRFAGLC